MRERKGNKGKWARWMSVILAVLCIFGIYKIPVQAATLIEECAGVVALFNDNGEVVDASTAIVMNLDGSLGVFAMPFDGDMSSAYVTLVTGTGNQYKLLFVDEATVGGTKLFLWELDPSGEGYAGASSDTAFLEVDDPYQNEVALAVYFEMGTNEITSSAMILLECSDTGMLTVDSYPSNAQYPAALVNENGKLIGICLGEGAIWAIRNGAEFYSNAATPAPSEAPVAPEEPDTSDTKAPPLPEREERQPSEGQEAQEENTVAVPKETPASSSSPVTPNVGGTSSSNLTLIGAVAAAVIVVVVVVIVLAGKKKKQGTVPPQTAESSPVFRAEAESIPNTMPVQSSTSDSSSNLDYGISAEPSKLWLAARGGCMNGRVYPVEQHEITIGRDASSVIRYPSDTVGVSRVHAKLYWQDGRLMLMDCNSTSGTFLQRQGKLSPMVPVEVRSGDAFYIGEKINSFEIKE